MTCAGFRRRCLCYRSFFGEIGLGRTHAEADAAADHRAGCPGCALWYHERLEEERAGPRLAVLRRGSRLRPAARGAGAPG